MRWTIGIVGYGVNPNANCFEDFAFALSDALKALGHDVVPHTDDKPGRLIMMGANNVSDPDSKIPEDAIVFNTEQMTAVHKASFLMANFAQYRNHVVWDYSKANIARLNQAGITRAVHCPLGYIPSMTKFGPAVDQDIDVLFYGSINPRRKEILKPLAESGLKFSTMFGLYGDERDKVIARAKVVVNVHFYDHAVFEIFRCSHLFANQVAVVSEDGGEDEEWEAFARKATCCMSAGKLLDACRELVDDEITRRDVAERGYLMFSETSLVENVRRAIAESAM